MMPFSPLLTKRPSEFHVRIPATLVRAAAEGVSLRVKKLRGRMEAESARSFANDTELWRWIYVLAMDGADAA
jgi:hypothetical protein